MNNKNNYLINFFNEKKYSNYSNEGEIQEIKKYVNFILNKENILKWENGFKNNFNYNNTIPENKYTIDYDIKTIPDEDILNKPIFYARSGYLGYDLLLPFLYDVNPELLNILLKNDKIKKEIITMSHNQAGIYDTNPETYLKTLKEYCKKYVEGIKNATHLGMLFERTQNLGQYYFNQYHKDIYRMEWFMNNFSMCGSKTYGRPSWMEFFKNKKVLFITSFPETAKKQIANNNLFKLYEVEPFEMKIDLCKSPISFCGNTPDNNILESIEKFKLDVSKKDFDIAIVGCGGYSVIISNYIYSEMKKSAIIVGGMIQLFFGIKGNRWNKYNMYNEFWCNVLESEIPKNKELVEGGCYF